MTRKKSAGPIKTEVKLDYPVEFQGETIDVLHFRRIKGKDLKKLDKRGEDLESSFLLFADLTEQPPELFDEVDGADIESIGKVIEGFLGKAASAKKKPSRSTSQT